MARLDLPDKWRDEDCSLSSPSGPLTGHTGDVDDPVTSGDEQGDDRPLTEPYQLDVWECVALAEQDAA